MIEITQNAWKKLLNIKKKDTFTFVFSATGGGCGGFNYNIKHVTFGQYTKMYNTHKKNLYTIQNKTAKVIIDPPSEMLLFGTTIDHVSNDFESKFIFIPQKDLATTCGCGTSFSLKTSTR